LADEVDAKVVAPSDSEVETLYEQNKERIGKPLAEAKPGLVDMMKQNRKIQAMNAFVASLKKDADVKIILEPIRVDIDTKGASFVGEKNAKVTLIEFSDYQCPYCKKVRPSIWKLMDEYKGQIKYVFMDFPLSFHKDAQKAAEAAHCAGDQDKYFEFNKKAFDSQPNIGIEDLKKVAGELGLNVKNFEKCLSSGKHAKEVEASQNVGMAAGVSGTPAYFINGIMLSGAMPYESFKQVIDTELKR
jgi:protein-disulfide isomerase